MKLSEYLESQKITITEMAGLCGLSFHQLYNLKVGRGNPSIQSALVVEHFTKGKITPKDLISEELKNKIYNRAVHQNKKSVHTEVVTKAKEN